MATARSTRWTEERDLILRSGFEAGLTDEELAEKLGVTPVAASVRRKKLGIRRGPTPARGERRTETLCMPFSADERQIVDRAVELSGASQAIWATAALLNAAEPLELNPKFWTKERDEALREWYTVGRSDKWIASRLGASVSAVTKRRLAHGLKRPSRRRPKRGRVPWERPICIRLTKTHMRTIRAGSGRRDLAMWGRGVLLEEATETVAAQEELEQLRSATGLRVANLRRSLLR